MRLARRIFAFLNLAFQLPVGLAAMFVPGLAAGAFAIPLDGAPAVSALVRMFGGLLAGAGLFSGWVGLDPDRPLALRRLLAAALLLNVVADTVVLGAGELGPAQVGGGMGLELIFAGLLLLP